MIVAGGGGAERYLGSPKSHGSSCLNRHPRHVSLNQKIEAGSTQVRIVPSSSLPSQQTPSEQEFSVHQKKTPNKSCRVVRGHSGSRLPNGWPLLSEARCRLFPPLHASLVHSGALKYGMQMRPVLPRSTVSHREAPRLRPRLDLRCNDARDGGLRMSARLDGGGLV